MKAYFTENVPPQIHGWFLENVFALVASGYTGIVP